MTVRRGGGGEEGEERRGRRGEEEGGGEERGTLTVGPAPVDDEERLSFKVEHNSALWEPFCEAVLKVHCVVLKKRKKKNNNKKKQNKKTK